MWAPCGAPVPWASIVHGSMKNAMTGSRVAGAAVGAAAVRKLCGEGNGFGRPNSASPTGECRSCKARAKRLRSQCLRGRLRSRPCRLLIPRRDRASSAASRRSSALARSVPSAAPTSISTAGWPASMPSQPRRRTPTTLSTPPARRAMPARPERSAPPRPGRRPRCARLETTPLTTRPGRASDTAACDTVGFCRLAFLFGSRSWTAPGRASITRRARLTASHCEPGAQVAQLVEHVTENHGVGGSIPPLGTTNT